MSSSYSANQYDSAFKSQGLQNWCEPKRFKQRPAAQVGHTTFITDDKGHLLPGMVKKGSAWPDFKGTWDHPARIPALRINPTARSVEGLNRLRTWGFSPQCSGKSPPHGGSKSTDHLQEAGEQTGADGQQDGAIPSSAAEARPASQKSRPGTGGDRAASRNQNSQAAVAGSANPPVTQASEPAGQGTPSRPDTGEGRPAAPSSSQQQHRDEQQDQ